LYLCVCEYRRERRKESRVKRKIVHKKEIIPGAVA